MECALSYFGEDGGGREMSRGKKSKSPGVLKYEKRKLLQEKIEHYERYSGAAEPKRSGLKLIYTPMGNKR